MANQSVVACNVSVVPDAAGICEVTYSFLCPGCGEKHTQREADGQRPIFDRVHYSRCGGIQVVMPWGVK